MPASVAQWQLIDKNGDPLRRGTSTLDQAPRAPQLIALVPASRVVFIETPLPSANVSPQKRDQLVRYAIEDKLTIDPATVHAVVLDQPRNRTAARNANHIVAAIDRAWFAAALKWLAAAGLAPRSVFPETALLPVAAGEWSVQLATPDHRHAYARRADGFAYALDAAGGNAPPFSLTLALNEAADKPQAITLHADGAAIDPALVANWQTALAVPVRVATAARTGRFNMVMKSANLLAGDFAPAQPARAWVALAWPAIMVAGLIVCAHVVFTAVDWWRLDRQRQRLTGEINKTFQEAFPQAAIVDAPLQMRRNLEQLKRERGLVKPDDPRTALARLAAIIAATPQVSVTEVSIKDGQAKLTAKLAPNADAAMAALQERIAGIGSARLSAGTAPDTIEITLRVGA